MAEIAIKEEKKVKVRPMMYRNTKTVEDEERELEELEAQISGEEQAEAEAKEQEIAEHDANLSAEEKTFKKRYGDLRRHAQKQKAEFEKELADIRAQLAQTAQEQIKLPKSEEEIDAWAKEYPDVAAIVETIASKKAKEQQSHLEARMKEIDEMQSAATRDKAEAELLNIHPDFEQIRDDDAFHDWAEEQPKWVQQALYENEADAKSAARAIDLYKADMGLPNRVRRVVLLMQIVMLRWMYRRAQTYRCRKRKVRSWNPSSLPCRTNSMSVCKMKSLPQWKRQIYLRRIRSIVVYHY